MRFFFFFFFIFFFFICSSQGAVRLNNEAVRRFVDSETGQELFFHGTNAVVKGPPWLPDHLTFSPYTSLSEYDFKMMFSLGLNVVRLGTMWPGAQPNAPSALDTGFDQKYLANIEAIVRLAAKNDV